jgi:putative membrane protein
MQSFRLKLLKYLDISIILDFKPHLFLGFWKLNLRSNSGFKLSQSYDRWWEARKIWGSIVNDSRSLVMQLHSFTNKENRTVTDRMAYRQIAWCYSLSQKLRNESASKNINEFIAQEELDSIRNQNSIPLALLANQTQDLSVLHDQDLVNDFQQIQIDHTLVNLCASMGKAERIKNTAFPKTYRLTLRLFIFIFLVTLSVALTEMPSLAEIPFLIIISIPFFLLEKVAFNIQNPFENKPMDIPMTSISRTIEINIKELLGDKNSPKPMTSETFYVL